MRSMLVNATHLGLAFSLMAGAAASQAPPRAASPADSAMVDSAFVVDGSVALASFISLTDTHLQKLADFLAVLASGDARSGEWARIRGPLAQVGRHNIPAALWFALPDGSYWTVGEGRAAGNLASRAYFPRLMAGEPVTGALVVSRSTGKSVAIVAVPVRRADGRVIGALGSSIYLDSLSLRLTREMNLPEDVVFYAIDATPIGAVHREVDMIFTEPLKLGADLSRAIRDMMAHDHGIVSYEFKHRRRTMLYRRSPVTGWWYALGVVRHETAGTGP
jgi:hypothetical protein